MNLIYGEIVETFPGAEMPKAKVRVRGALAEVALGLTPDAGPGDCVLICDGVAIGKVADTAELEKSYVSGNSRKST